jgi:hypothetical protein
VFPTVGGRTALPAGELLRQQHEELLGRVSRWSGLDTEEVNTLLVKLEDRADALALVYRRNEQGRKIADVTALATALAMDFAYTGRLTE